MRTQEEYVQWAFQALRDKHLLIMAIEKLRAERRQPARILSPGEIWYFKTHSKEHKALINLWESALKGNFPNNKDMLNVPEWSISQDPLYGILCHYLSNTGFGAMCLFKHYCEKAGKLEAVFELEFDKYCELCRLFCNVSLNRKGKEQPDIKYRPFIEFLSRL